MLKAADKRNLFMMAATPGSTANNTNNDGLIGGHAYSLISVVEFEHEGQQVRLLKMRNPWGKGEWTGDWSDKSEYWTEELR